METPPTNNGEINMVADYTMDEDKWTSRKALVTNHMKTNDLGDAAAPIQYQLTQGDKQPEFRKRFWANITNMFATMDNSPIKIGPKSSLPQAVQDSIATICAVYAAGLTALYASHPLFGETERMRGKANYAQFEDAESYGKQKSKNIKSRFTGYYKAYTDKDAESIQWNGTLNKAGVPILVAPVPKAVTE